MDNKVTRDWLTTRDGHFVYYQAQHTGGIPVLIFHGGWGPLQHDGAFLDKLRYQHIYIHQRGWGQSRPRGCLENNDVDNILKDCEDIRRKLNIEKWIVAGGSTGAMLAFAYGSQYPDSCLGVLLRGLWLLSPRELDFNYQDPKGKAYFYPNEWDKFLAGSFQHSNLADSKEPAYKDSSQVIRRYHQLVNGKDRTVAATAAQAWMSWDSLGSSVLRTDTTEASDDVAIDTAKIGLHLYMEAQRSGDGLFEKGTKIMAEKGLKIRLVTGRYDMLCPPAWAYKVAKEITKLGGDASCTIVDGAAHSELDPGMVEAMKCALNSF